MKPQTTNNNDPELLENDEVWDLLAQSPKVQASPTFLQNTVRAARLSQKKQPSLLQRLLSPPAFAGYAVTVITLCMVISLRPDNSTSTPIADNTAPASTQEQVQNDWLDQTLLATAVEKPELFSEDELLALIF